MNAEKQIIGSLLIDASRIDDIKIINSEMFEDSTLGEIFSCFEHADGKEVNLLTIAHRIVTGYRNETQSQQLLVNLASEHDAGISDRSCEEIIFANYKARKVNEILNHTQIDADNVDSVLELLQNTADALAKNEEAEVQTLSELTALQNNYFNENHKVKFEIGIARVDEAIGGLDDGDVTIISARPSVGKSALALQIGRKYAKEGHSVGYFNLEMGNKQIYERAVASSSGLDMTRIRRATSFLNDEEEKFREGNRILQEETNFHVITKARTIKQIRAMVKKYKFDVIIIDYLQLIQATTYRGGNRASEVGDVSRGLKSIATDFMIPVIALSQLNRESEKLKDKEPSLADLRESGDIEQDASVVLMMWKSNEDDKTERTIKVEKSRNGFNEKVKLYFDGKHMMFSDAEEDKDFRDTRENEDIPWN